MLEAATAYLAKRINEVTGVAITYSREGDFGSESIPLTATRGSTVFESTDADNIVSRWESKDYIVEANTFTFGEPVDGDLIVDGDRQYRVHAMPGSKPFRFSDPGRSMLRIHTKHIGTA